MTDTQNIEWSDFSNLKTRPFPKIIVTQRVYYYLGPPPLCLVKLIPPKFCCLEEIAKQSSSSLLFNVLIQIELIDYVLDIYLISEQLIAAKVLQIVITTPHIDTHCSPLNFFH